MKRIILYTALLFCLCACHNRLEAQCALLFIKAPDTICKGSKELVLRTSKVAANNVKYIWRMPKGDTTTTDTILTIQNPISNMHAGDYYVSTQSTTCNAPSIGPLKVIILGAPTALDTVHKKQLCGINETELISKYKTSSTITGKWFGAFGVDILEKEKEETIVKNLKVGDNILIWEVSTRFCQAFFRDTFRVRVEPTPQIDTDNYTLNDRNASLTIPLGTVNGSNILTVEDLSIKIEMFPKGELLINNKNLKYERKVGFSGEDKFSIKVCNNRCSTLCSAVTTFTIKVEYDEQYPNVTVPQVLSPQQMSSQGFEIENVKCYPVNELIILDRWGTIIEKKENYPLKEGNWDGRHNGKLLPTGAYYFVFQAKKDCNPSPKENFKPISGIFYIID